MAAPIAEQVSEQLTPYLGPLNAKVAVRTFSQKNLGLAADQLTLAHVPALLDALKPMLYTFVGRASTDALLEKIQRGVK